MLKIIAHLVLLLLVHLEYKEGYWKYIGKTSL